MPFTFGQIISYTPSKGGGVSYSVNIPEDTAAAGSGPIYLQLKAPSNLKWIALGQGPQMADGNMFVVYSASEKNVTLSPRRSPSHYEPLYSPDIEAYLLEGSGISNGTMTANIRCDNCMLLHNGKSIMGQHSEWIWAITGGAALDTTNVSYKLYQHDWHGIFSLDLTMATGGNSTNPFMASGEEHSYSIVDYTTKSKQQQISDTLVHRKRISHGVMTSVAFVLLFPNFGLTLYLFPSRWTVVWIHAPLQIFATLLALTGLAVGISVSQDIQDVSGYHPVIGYIAVFGVVLFQPFLGIMQHLRFRMSGKETLYGVAHRYLGRFLSIMGIINGGIGFSYAYTKNPDIPLSSRYSYGIIAGSQGIIYVLVIWWRRSKDKKAKAQAQAQVDGNADPEGGKDRRDSEAGSSTTVDGSLEKVEVKAWSG